MRLTENRLRNIIRKELLLMESEESGNETDALGQAILKFFNITEGVADLAGTLGGGLIIAGSFFPGIRGTGIGGLMIAAGSILNKGANWHTIGEVTTKIAYDQELTPVDIFDYVITIAAEAMTASIPNADMTLRGATNQIKKAIADVVNPNNMQLATRLPFYKMSTTSGNLILKKLCQAAGLALFGTLSKIFASDLINSLPDKAKEICAIFVKEFQSLHDGIENLRKGAYSVQTTEANKDGFKYGKKGFFTYFKGVSAVYGDYPLLFWNVDKNWKGGKYAVGKNVTVFAFYNGKFVGSINVPRLDAEGNAKKVIEQVRAKMPETNKSMLGVFGGHMNYVADA